MNKIAFNPLHTQNADLTIVQQRIRDVVDAIVAAIPSSFVLASFIANGSNGIGYVQLNAIKNVDGSLRVRALSRATLVSAVNLTDDTDVQSSFESALGLPGQIKQVATTNLSAKKILFIILQSA